ncbi:MAG: TonB C-terminal domain-containing protein [Janthinobacterium lividum]
MPSPLPIPTDESELPPRSSTREADPAFPSISETEAGTANATNLQMAQGSEVISDPDAPLSFIPHTPLNETTRPQPLRIRTGRYGELDEHELVTLLDTIEDERARARFRESIYISVFVWIAVVLFLFFGPRYLWHSPRLVLPSEVLQARELTSLNAPSLEAPHLHTAPPAVDSHTLENLRSHEPRVAPAPRPRPAEPTPRIEPHPVPPTTTPKFQPPTAPPNLPSAPAPQVTPSPRTPPPPVVADAPRPQPATRPDFNTGPQSAGDAIQNAVQNATPGSGSSGGIRSRPSRGGSEVGMGPAEILSDTQGVNFNPYLQRILREIYDQWIPLIPEEARPPLMKSGVTMIRFTILPDGTIGAMHLDGSTHDDALNRAAWGSVTGVGQFPSLPSQFHGPNLELRIHYLVNRQTE